MSYRNFGPRGRGGRNSNRGGRGGYNSGNVNNNSNAGSNYSSRGREICGYHLKGKCEFETQHHGQSCRYPHFLKKIGQTHGHTGPIKDVAMWTARQQLFTCAADGLIKLWDCASWQELTTLNVQQTVSTAPTPTSTPAVKIPNNEGVSCMVLEGPLLFVGFESPFPLNPSVTVGMVRAYHLEQAGQSFEFRVSDAMPFAHPTRVQALAFATDVRGMPTVFSGSADGSIRYWQMDAATNEFKCCGQLEGHVRGISRLKTFMMGTSSILASASVDGTIRLWDLSTYQCVRALSAEDNGHSDAVMDLEFWVNGNESFLISGGLDNEIIVWNLAPPFQQLFKEKQESQVTALCGAQDTAQAPILLIGTADGAMTIKELPTFAYKTTVSRQHNFGHQEAVRRITTGPLNTIFTVGNDSRMIAWQITGAVSAIQSK